jgi:hypothetical protein
LGYLRHLGTYLRHRRDLRRHLRHLGYLWLRGYRRGGRRVWGGRAARVPRSGALALGRAARLIRPAAQVVGGRPGGPGRRTAAAPEQPATSPPGFLATGVGRVSILPGLGRIWGYLSGVASSGRPVIVI